LKKNDYFCENLNVMIMNLAKCYFSLSHFFGEHLLRKTINKVNKKLFTSFLFLFLGLGLFAQTGATCNEADVVSVIPYTATGLTTIGTTYASLPCSGSGYTNYMSGKDYVFTFTPTITANYNITLTNTSYAVGLFVTDLCPDDVNVQCVAYTTSMTGNPTLSTTLTANIPYYIIVSSNNYIAQQTAFNISIQSCTTPPSSSFTYAQNGLDVTFTNTSTDATHYLWYFGDETLPPPLSQGDTTTNPAHTYAAYGSYVVTLISYNACGSIDTLIDTLTLVCPGTMPVASFTFTQNAGTVQCTSTSTDATSWQWFFGDTDIFPYLPGDTTENPSHTYIADATYTIYLIVTNECGSDTISQSITITGTSVNAVSLSKISIYPNPVKQEFTINMNSIQKATLEITDLAGKILIQQPLISNSTTINISGLQNGMYFIRIKSNEGTNILPLIKE
jgi:PKD repeat protein